MNFALSDEQNLFRNTVRDFAEAELAPRAHEVDVTGSFNWAAVRKMGPLGLLGLNAPEEYGGAGVDAVSAAIALEEIARGCGSTALAVAAHNGLACGPWRCLAATLRRTPRCALGDGSGTTGRAGADGTRRGLRPGGRRQDLGGRGGRLVDHRRREDVDDQCLSRRCDHRARRTDRSGGSHALSMFIVPTDAQGVSIGPPEQKMGLHGSPTHAVTFSEVRIPRENLLGTVGRGLQQTLTVLDGGRIGIGALCVGLAQAAFEEALRYARERHTFGQAIAQHQSIQNMLADMATEIEAARLLVYEAAWIKQQGKVYTRRPPRWLSCLPATFPSASATTRSKSMAAMATLRTFPWSAFTATSA